MKTANQTAKGADVVESETKIVNLADAPEFLEEVSRWLWLEWAKADGYTLEEIIYRTKYASQKDTVPQTLVAVRDGKPVGVVSLWLNDLKTRQDLSPWMATLYVKDEYRTCTSASSSSGPASRLCGPEPVPLSLPHHQAGQLLREAGLAVCGEGARGWRSDGEDLPLRFLSK